MKLHYMLALSLTLTCAYVTSGHASDDKVEIKANDHHGKREFKMKVKRSGDHYVGIYDNHEYVLRGDAVRTINTEGDYTVYGDVGPDNTYFTTTEVQPVVIEERREPVVREREVIVERRREPDIKIGPVEIGHH